MSYMIVSTISLLSRLTTRLTCEEAIMLTHKIREYPNAFAERLVKFSVGHQKTNGESFMKIIMRGKDQNASWAYPLDTDTANREFSGWDLQGKENFFSIDFLEHGPIDCGENIKSILDIYKELLLEFSQIIRARNIAYSWTFQKLMIDSEIPVLTVLFHNDCMLRSEIACFFIYPGNQDKIDYKIFLPTSNDPAFKKY